MEYGAVQDVYTNKIIKAILNIMHILQLTPNTCDAWLLGSRIDI